MNPETWVEHNLNALREQHLERSLSPMPEAGGVINTPRGPLLNFGSNDYLNLARHPHVVQRAADALAHYGAGATASRLIAGTLPVHEELEARLAAYKGRPACLVFGSGYLANAGSIPALVDRGDTILADRLSHACIIDGAVLSRASRLRFQHNDMDHLASMLAQQRKGRKLIVTESVFSMDGDIAPLRELVRLAQEHDAMLLVDEAHATGVFGPAGSGLIRAEGLQDGVTLSMFTMSKGMGGYGGAVACSAAMKQWLINKARAFIFTTALPPAVLGATLGAIDVLEREPELGATLLQRAQRLRTLLTDGGLDCLGSQSQIIPVLVKDNEKVVRIAKKLREQQIIVGAIRPPTVPPGTARLRLSVTLAHTDEHLRQTAAAVIASCREELIP